MKVQVETLSPIERKLSIEVDAKKVSEELTRAYAALNRRVKVAGFRTGKIPRRILEQRFRSEVEGDVTQRVVERAYLDALAEQKVDAVANPQIQASAPLREDQPYSFEAKVQVKPEVAPKDYAGLPLKKRELKVEEAQVEERINRLQQANSSLEPVTGRDTVEGKDFAVIDYTATVEGNSFPGSNGQEVTVEVAPGELTRGNIEALVGAKVGENKAVPYTFPADYPVEEVRGKPAEFHCTVKGIKTRVLPALDDAFAEKVQGGKTLAELKEKIRTDLLSAQKRQSAQEEREELLKALVERNGFEVPTAMVDRAIDLMIQGAFRSMMDQGMDPRQLGLDFNRLREEMRPKADLEVRGSLLLEAVAQKESLQASDEDVEKKMVELAELDGIPLARVKQHFRTPSDRAALKQKLLEEKAVEFLKARATYS